MAGCVHFWVPGVVRGSSMGVFQAGLNSDWDYLNPSSVT